MLAIGYILGIVMVLFGALILFGYFEFRGGSPEGSNMLSTMFGIVLLLYGVYRIAVSEMARRQRERDGDING